MLSTISTDPVLQICLTARGGEGRSRPDSIYHGKKLAFSTIRDAREYIETSQAYILEAQNPKCRNEILFDVDVMFSNGLQWQGMFRADSMDFNVSGYGMDLNRGDSVRPQYLAESIQRSLENESEFSRDKGVRDHAETILRECTLEEEFVGEKDVAQFGISSDGRTPSLGEVAGMKAPSLASLSRSIDRKMDLGDRRISF